MATLGSLREERAKRLMTTRALRDLSKVSLSTITLIENGHRVPRFETIESLAKALKIDPMDVDEFRAAIEKASQPKPK